MRATPIPRRGLLAATTLAVLAGCASVDADRAVQSTNAQLATYSTARLEAADTPERQAALAERSAQWLTAPLDQETAVRLALANSPAVQALLAQTEDQLAQAAQGARVANPVLSFERMRAGDEREYGRLLSFGLLELLTLPRRLELANSAQAQAQLQLAAAVVEQIRQVREAWVRAVAAQQMLAYAAQVQRAAQAGAELARRMQQVGNFTRLQRARQHAFYADAAAQHAAAEQAALATREALVRALALSDAQAAQLQLPPRLPDLPATPRETQVLNAAALQQRLDVQLARAQLDNAGRAQGLALLGSLVDTEFGVRRDTLYDTHSGEKSHKTGFELALRLPLFDWGSAQRAAMNAQSRAAAHRYDATARAATSQLRESYGAYRTAHAIARHWRDEIVPLRKTMAEENLLRYNGMFIGVFELLADTREQIASVVAALQAQQQFWLADAALSSSLIGQPVTPAALAAGGSAATAAPAH